MEQQKAERRRKNSKGKGNGFETTVAKLLSGALAPVNFIRTQGSGARVGGKNFETIGQLFGEDALRIFVGDVVPVNERQAGVTFLHTLECKFYAAPDSFTALAAGTANIFRWYEEAVDDAAKVKKNPLLIFKWNRTPIFAALDPLYPGCPRADIDPLLALRQFQVPVELNIYYLADLLKNRHFWCASNGN